MKKLRSVLSRGLKWFGDQIDTFLALLLGAICSILGIVGVVQPSILASATLGTLTVLAFALMRDRFEREKFQKHLNQLSMKFDGQTLDAFFKQNIDEETILLNAEQEVWMIQETGAYIIETQKAAIISFLKRGGILRIVITSPREDIRRQLAFRNHDFPYEAIENRFQIFRHYIDSILNTNGLNSENVQVRFLPYVIDTSEVIVDPENIVEKKRKAIIRYPGFRSPFEDRLGISLEGDKAPKVFSYFFREAERIFQHAQKVVLVIDSVHAAKSNVLMEGVEQMNHEEKTRVFFLHNRTILKGSNSKIEVKTSINQTLRTFTIQNGNDNYKINTTDWEVINSELLDAYKKKKLLILDEIGSLQMGNPNFLNMIETIMNDPNSSLFARIVLDEKNALAVRKLRFHYRSTVLYFSTHEKERNHIKQVLETEMKASLLLTKIEP